MRLKSYESHACLRRGTTLGLYTICQKYMYDIQANQYWWYQTNKCLTHGQKQNECQQGEPLGHRQANWPSQQLSSSGWENQSLKTLVVQICLLYAAVLYSSTGALIIEAYPWCTICTYHSTKTNWIDTNLNFLCLVPRIKYPTVPTCKFTGESSVDRFIFIYQTNSY